MDLRKYPSTPHLAFSQSLGEGDKFGKDFAFFGQEGVVTEKMDGENTTLYRNYLHARSRDSQDHPSRSWVKAHHGAVRFLIPEDTRVIVENVYARHSVAYDSLPSFAFGIAAVREGHFLSWEESCDLFALLQLPSVPVLYRGIITEAKLRELAASLDTERQEGLVVRTAGSFPEASFAQHVGKWVRKNHVQTDQHWTKSWVPNRMSKEA